MKKNNWVLEIAKGLLIFIFGLFCLVNPASASVTLTWIFAIVILVLSILAITDAFMLKSVFTLWWILLFESLIGVVFAALLLFNPDKMTLVIKLMGAWAIVAGAFRFFRIVGKKDLLLSNGLFGLGLVALGVLFLVFSEVIINFATVIIGAAACIFGLIIIIIGVLAKRNKAA